MKLDSNECRDKLISYKNSKKHDEFELLCIDILLLKDGEVVDIVDKYLDNFPTHKQKFILNKITERIRELHELFGIDIEKTENVDLNKFSMDNINRFKINLIQYISNYMDELDNCDIKEYETYVTAVKEYTDGFMNGALDIYMKLKKDLVEFNDKVDIENKMKDKNIKIIK